ncbi:MAG: hypothetical protein HYR96_14530 [Deltaproteobacteria bacterium]|nr:hypothetical protein [Deltaproteobacteria bacterium]MBI3295517.1 hypothetical protein [Deltaproteobacteria bacterium]
MTRVSIDSQNDSVDVSNAKSVGDALDQALTVIPQTRFVSEIEVDGHRIRHYLSEDEVHRLIDSVQEVKIYTADRAQWAANGFDVALSSLEQIQRTLIVTAGLFRESQSLEANRLFARCMDGLERFWDAVTMTRTALKLEFKMVQVNTAWTLADLEIQFLDIIKGFVELQNGQFYEALADKVEFELIPHLSRWSEALCRLRTAQSQDS